MKVCFFTAGPVSWASSRMRAYWPAQYMDAVVIPLAEVHHGHASIPPAEVYVFQKTFSGRVRESLPPGSLVIWDVCDPLWWFDPEGSRATLAAVDGITACTISLIDDLREWDSWNNDKPIVIVHDCIDPAHFPMKATHTDYRPVVRLIWYGIFANRVALHAAQANLERLAAEGYKIQLTIMDEHPNVNRVFMTDVAFPVLFTEWSLARENEVIAAHDIALLPPFPGPWGALKSNNKNLAAWACNVPTATGLEYALLKELVESAGKRDRQAYANYWITEKHTPVVIAQEWQAAFGYIQDDLLSDERQRAVSVTDSAAVAAA